MAEHTQKQTTCGQAAQKQTTSGPAFFGWLMLCLLQK